MPKNDYLGNHFRPDPKPEPRAKKQPKPIPKVSKKQKEAIKNKISAYQEYDESHEKFCHGCGMYNVPLSHSHIIPVSRRKDLESDQNNFSYHCFGSSESCHEKWESGQFELMSDLKDYNKRMDYIQKNDKEYFNLLLAKFDEQVNGRG